MEKLLKTIIKSLTITTIVVTFTSCSYDELPPKTDDATTSYILPKGVIPSAEESEYVENIRKEYTNSLKQ